MIGSRQPPDADADPGLHPRAVVDSQQKTRPPPNLPFPRPAKERVSVVQVGRVLESLPKESYNIHSLPD
ncbi:MAG: hypothetical protein U0350_05010 [Caldilineaceae bacterium]